jgi:hypothetical protein
MNILERLKTLSGQNSKQPTIDQMRADLKEISSQYDSALKTVENGQQIDEGFFTSLKAAFQTAAQVGKSSAAAVGDKVSAIYQDKKAQAELKILFDQLKTIVDKFDEIANSAPTIFKNDKQIAKEMDYFRRVMIKMIQTLSSRLAIKEGVSSSIDIEKLLKDEGLLEYISNEKILKEPIEDPKAE